MAENDLVHHTVLLLCYSVYPVGQFAKLSYTPIEQSEYNCYKMLVFTNCQPSSIDCFHPGVCTFKLILTTIDIYCD